MESKPKRIATPLVRARADASVVTTTDGTPGWNPLEVRIVPIVFD